MVANISAFSAALAGVAAKHVTGPKFIYNIITENNFETLAYMLMGRPMSDLLRAGSQIQARIKAAVSSKSGFYNVPTEDHSPQVGNDGNLAVTRWAAHMSHETWFEEELLINSGGVGAGDVAEETWTQEMFNKLQSLVTATAISIAASMWARPDTTTMGGNDPKAWNSIPYYINQMTNGLFNPGTNNGSAFTTIDGLDVSSGALNKHKPLQLQYGGASAHGFTANDPDNLVYFLTRAVRKTTFKGPTWHQEYFDPEDETAIDRSGGFIAGSEVGVSKLEHLYRNSQHRWDDYMDPAGNPRIKKIPVIYESQLDNAQLYPISTTSVGTETTATVTGPRYYGVNAKRMKMYFHVGRHLKFLEPFRVGLTKWQQGVNTLGAMFCPDRSKHFILYPQTSH